MVNLQELAQKLFPSYELPKQLVRLRQLKARINKALAKENDPLQIGDNSNKKDPLEQRHWSLDFTTQTTNTQDYSNERFKNLAKTLLGDSDLYQTTNYIHNLAFETDAKKLGQKTLKIFVSLSVKDIALSKQVFSYLDPILSDLENKTNHKIIVFHFVPLEAPSRSSIYYQHLEGGDEFDELVRQNIIFADISLLFLSENFTKSQYISDIEIPLTYCATQVIPVALGKINTKDMHPLIQPKQIVFYRANENKASFSELSAEPFKEKFTESIQGAIKKKVIIIGKLLKCNLVKKSKTPLENFEFFLEKLIHINPYIKNIENETNHQSYNLSAKELISNNLLADKYNLKEYVMQKIVPSAFAIGNKEIILQENKPLGAIEYITDWANTFAKSPTKDNNYLVVLGEYGMGKTFLCRMIAYTLLNQKQEPITPFYLDLQNWKLHNDKYDIENFIKQELKNKTNTTITTYISWLEWIQNNPSLVIFDGLDEITVKMNRSQAKDLLNEMLKITIPLQSNATLKNAFIISCRTHYFKDIQDQFSLLNIDSRGHKDLSKNKIVSLLPFDDEQINSFISLRLPLQDKERALEMINHIYNLKEVAKRPVLLEQFCSKFELLSTALVKKQNISSTFFYTTFEQEWLTRDNAKHKINTMTKSILMQDLALYLWSKNTNSMHSHELEKWLRKWLQKSKHSILQYNIDANTIEDYLQVLFEDIRTASFVVRSASEQEFRFAHTSMKEYFIATAFIRILQEGKKIVQKQLSVQNFSKETWDFIIELLDKDTKDKEQVLQKIQKVLQKVLAVKQNQPLRILLITFWQKVQDASLATFAFSPLDLSDSNFSHHTFDGLNLSHASFDHANLSFASIHNCRLSHSTFHNANLTSLEAYKSTFHNAHLAKANTYSASLLECSPIQDNPHLLQIRLSSKMQNPQRLVTEIGHTSPIYSLALSPDGSKIMSGSRDNTIKIWGSENYQCLETLKGHTGSISSLAFSPDGSKIISGSEDDTIKIWDSENYQCLNEIIQYSDIIFCSLDKQKNSLLDANNLHLLLPYERPYGVNEKNERLPIEAFYPKLIKQRENTRR